MDDNDKQWRWQTTMTVNDNNRWQQRPMTMEDDDGQWWQTTTTDDNIDNDISSSKDNLQSYDQGQTPSLSWANSFL